MEIKIPLWKCWNLLMALNSTTTTENPKKSDCKITLTLNLISNFECLLGTLNENKNTSVEVLESVDDLRCLDSHRVMECRRRS